MLQYKPHIEGKATSEFELSCEATSTPKTDKSEKSQPNITNFCQPSRKEIDATPLRRRRLEI